jgi:hypothetical protein
MAFSMRRRPVSGRLRVAMAHQTSFTSKNVHIVIHDDAILEPRVSPKNSRHHILGFPLKFLLDGNHAAQDRWDETDALDIRNSGNRLIDPGLPRKSQKMDVL